MFPFSKRTDWSLENNPLSLALDKMHAAKTPILDLTESNPTQCGFKYPASWLQALSSPETFLYAPQAKGIVSARGAVSAYYGERKTNIDPEHIVLTSSTSEGYSFLLKLLTNAGDHVLVPKPSYPLFQFLLELHDVNFDYYPMTYVNGAWVIDQEVFKNLVTPKTKAVILVNPNNPTCSYIGAADRLFLNTQCVMHSMAIISDEVFLDYQLNANIEAKSLAGNAGALTFVLSGVSKILGMPQMKLSWIAVNGPSEVVAKAIERLEIIADTYLSVNTPVQNALASWLPQASEIQAQILERVKVNLKVLQQSGLNVLAVDGGWYGTIEVPALFSEEEFILNLLKTEHVLVHPGFFFDFEEEGYLILSLLPKPDVFAKALERIARQIQLL
jgi:alanine-synthesizing transaminase